MNVHTLAELPKPSLPIVHAGPVPPNSAVLPGGCSRRAPSSTSVLITRTTRRTVALPWRVGVVYVDRSMRAPDVHGVITRRAAITPSLAFACALAGIACTVCGCLSQFAEKNGRDGAFGAARSSMDATRRCARTPSRCADLGYCTASHSQRIWCSALQLTRIKLFTRSGALRRLRADRASARAFAA